MDDEDIPAALDRRTLITGGIVASTAALLPAGVRAASSAGYCDFAEFGPDPTGATPSDTAFHAWILAAIARRQVARAGAGRFVLATTHAFALDGDSLAIQGAGATHFQRAPNTIAKDFEALARFSGRGGSRLAISGIVVDMNCTQQPHPPGEPNLAVNFAWQHSIAIDCIPAEVGGFDSIHVADCEVRDPMSDGFGVRGGPPQGAGVREAVFERVANPSWPVEQQRPRVRGDITITAICTNVRVTDCVLPRLHYEVEAPIPPGTTMTVVEQNNRVGELLAHFKRNDPALGRATRTVTGGSIARLIFQGNCATRTTGTRITLRRPGNRLTGGLHRFEACAFIVGAEYRAEASPASVLFTSLHPAARTIEIVGGTLDVADGAAPPAYFLRRMGIGEGGGSILFDGFASRSRTMQLVVEDSTRLTVRNVTASYAGGGPNGGAFIILLNPREPGDFAVEISGTTLTDPRATLVCGCTAPRFPNAPPVALTLRGNRVESGHAVDLTSAGAGALAARTMARDGAWYMTGG